MALEYVPGSSLLHRLDPRAKMIWTFVISALTIGFLDPLMVGAVFLLIIVGIAVSKVPWRYFGQLYKPLGPVYLLYFVLNLYWYKGPTVYAEFLGGAYVVSLEGLLYSFSTVIRFTAIIAAIRLLTITTSISEFVLGLIKFRVPKEFGMALSIGLSYVPVLIDQTRKIMEAQMARAWKFEYRNPLRRIQALIPVLFPTIISSTFRGMSIAAAIESKGFGNVRNRTYRKVLKFNREDYALAGISAILFGIGMILIVFGWTDSLTLSLVKGFQT